MSKPKLLYIDDEQHNLVSFRSCFRSKFRILTAPDAETGLQLLMTHNALKNIDENIQIIVSDQRMPNLTGSRFFASIIDQFPDPTRILLTGYSDMSALVEAVNQGNIHAYFTKPWDQKDLEEVLLKAAEVFRVKMKEKESRKALLIANEQLEFMIRQKLLS